MAVSVSYRTDLLASGDRNRPVAFRAGAGGLCFLAEGHPRTRTRSNLTRK